MERHGRSQDSGPETTYDSPTFEKDVEIRVNETVGSASISPSGRDVVLASREGLHIIDLDSPYSPPRYVSHRSPWEVADVQWSPFASRDSWIVSTSNQKALVWNLNLTGSSSPIEHILHAHSNAITDINFSGLHPDILATCAVDSYVHCWDLRKPSRPVISFAEWFSGATQVKWNRQDSHIIASSHQRKVLIWDDRKGAYPLREIEAHSTQIYGLDWNRLRREALLTCSLDRSIKLWDYTKTDDSPERVIRTPYPVWRARHTPFGWGILAMPKRHDFDLHLYDRRLDSLNRGSKELPPVQSFKGHTDQVKEFLWRCRGGIEDGIDNREFQLVSWGSDRYLRLHKITSEQLESVGHRIGSEVHKKLRLTRTGASYQSYRDESPRNEHVQRPAMLKAPRISGLLGLSITQGGMGKSAALSTMNNATAAGMQGRRRVKKPENTIDWMGGVKMGKAAEGGVLGFGGRNSMGPIDHQVVWDTPDSLSDEITYVGKKFKKVSFEHVDVNRRSAVVSLNGPWGTDGASAFIRIAMKFPASYPVHAIPRYTFEKTTSAVTEEALGKLRHGLRTISEHFGMRSCGSLEAIIMYLLGERDLPDSLKFFPDPNTATEDSSSDEDAEEDIGEMNMSGSLDAALANASVPLPKACGAMWAEDGRLVCFFPPKAEPKPLFDLEALRGGDKFPKANRFLEDYGRWQSESPEPHDRSSHAFSDDSGSSSSGSLSSSVSSSSETSDSISDLPGRFMPPAAWRGATLRFQKSSQHSSAGHHQRPKTPPPKSYISIADTRDLLPARKELAQEYQVYGDPSAVCLNNREVAAKHNRPELAKVWELIWLILFNQVPLEMLQQNYREDPILVIASRAITRVKRKDSAADLFADSEHGLKGRVKWGNHPAAGAWLIPKLFEHFDKLADIQMLGMMSCIFAEPAAKQPVLNSIMRLREAELPTTMKSPAFSLDYFHSKEVAWSLFHHRSDNVKISQKRSLSFLQDGNQATTYGSAGSSNGPWSSDLVFGGASNIFSTNSTPPKPTKASAPRLNYPHSLSTSPERSLAFRRSSTNPFALALALPRPYTMTAPGSPPGPPFRSDEGELSTSAPTSGLTWSEATLYSSSGTANNSSYTRRRSNLSFASAIRGGSDSEDSSASSDEDHFDMRSSISRPRPSADSPQNAAVTVKLTLKNQNLFDDEAHASVPLLGVSTPELYMAYRTAYAEQLSVWQLPIARSEVLKFNGMTSYWPSPPVRWPESDASGTDGVSRRPLVKSARATNRFQKLQQSERGAPGESQCAICWRLIEGLHVPCPTCGEGKAHKECVEQWTADPVNSEGWCDLD